jgi:hypothetical protein
MKTIADEKGREKYIFPVFAIMSILILLSSVFFMAFPDITFDISMEYPNSSLRWADLDENSQIGMRFLILRPFWDEIIFGILGLYCAWGLRKREIMFWNLGIVWGVMMLTAGIALGLSEIIIGKWLEVCVVTWLYCIIGLIALSSLYISKEKFRAHAANM